MQTAVALTENNLVLGRYRPLRPLGSGGGGTVWLARDEHADRDVALKVVEREGSPAREPSARSTPPPACAIRAACARSRCPRRPSRLRRLPVHRGPHSRDALRAGAVDDSERRRSRRPGARSARPRPRERASSTATSSRPTSCSRTATRSPSASSTSGWRKSRRPTPSLPSGTSRNARLHRAGAARGPTTGAADVWSVGVTSGRRSRDDTRSGPSRRSRRPAGSGRAHRRCADVASRPPRRLCRAVDRVLSRSAPEAAERETGRRPPAKRRTDRTARRRAENSPAVLTRTGAAPCWRPLRGRYPLPAAVLSDRLAVLLAEEPPHSSRS